MSPKLHSFYLFQESKSAWLVSVLLAVGLLLASAGNVVLGQQQEGTSLRVPPGELKATLDGKTEKVKVEERPLLPPEIRLSEPFLTGFHRPGRTLDPPPFSPYFEVTSDGHPVVRIAAQALAAGDSEPMLTLRLVRWDAATGKNIPVAAHQRRLSADESGTGEAFRAIQLDAEFPDWWELPTGDYRVIVAAGPDGGDLKVFGRSPTFGPSERQVALRRRLEAWSQALFDLPYSTWYRASQDDADTAKNLLWRGAYRHARGITAAVTVENLEEEDEATPISVRLEAVFADGSRAPVAHEALLLSGSQEVAGRLSVPLGGRRRLTFGPIRLHADPQRERKLMEMLTGFVITVDPAIPDSAYPTTLQLALGKAPEPAAAAERIGLLLRIHQGDTPIDDGYPHAAYAQLLKQAIAHGAGPAFAADQSIVEAEYERFKQLAEVYQQGLAGTDGTNLDALTLHLDGYASRGFQFQFGNPNAGPILVSPSGDPGYESTRFTITHPWSESLFAAASAFVVPGISYADMAPLLAGVVTASEGKPETRRPAHLLLGFDLWAGLGVASEFDDPAVAKAIGALIDQGEIRLPPRLRRHLQTGIFSHLQGDFFEELAEQTIVRRHFEHQKLWPGGEGVTFVRIRRDQISDHEGKQLTDGLYIRVKVSGDGTISRSVVNVVEMKSGDDAAQGLPKQMAKDLRRLADGFQLTGLTEQQRKDLRVHTVGWRVGTGECPVAVSERLFVAITPRDAVVPKAMDEDLAGLDETSRRAVTAALRRPHRMIFDDREVKAATRAVFARYGVVAHEWDDPRLYFRQVAETTERTARALGRPVPLRAEIRTRYLAGERLNPSTGGWDVIPGLKDLSGRWQVPLIGPKEIVDMARAAFPNASPEEVTKYRQRAHQGERFNPETRSWVNPAAGNLLTVVDPRNPFEDPDALIEWFKTYRPGRFSEERIRKACADGSVFDPELDQFRRPKHNPDKSGRKNEVSRFSGRSHRDGDLNIPGRPSSGQIKANAWGELVIRLGTGASELAKMRNNTLEVLVRGSRTSPHAYIEVAMRYQDDKGKIHSVNLPPNAQQAILMSWYRKRLPENVRPLWMERIGG